MKKLFFFALVSMALISCTPTQQTTTMQTPIDNILTRVSVRQFTGEPISQQQIDTLLQCAMAAPSAINKQPWAFLVVTDEALLQRMGEAFPFSRCGNGAACAFVMCGDMTKTIEGEGQGFWINDVSAATENLLLAAHAMGLGAVWTGVYPSRERTAQVQELLGLPEYIIPMCIVPVGIPAEQPAVKQKFKEENVHYNRW